MIKRTKTIRWVLAMALLAAATANAMEPKIKVKVKVKPYLSLNLVSARLAMQVKYVAAGAPVKDDLFAGFEKFAQGASAVTEINLDPTTMQILGANRGPNAELARKLSLVAIRSYSYDKPGIYRVEDVDAFRKKLEDGSWSCSVHVRNQNSSSDICSRSTGDHETNEMVILSIRPQKISLIHMSGKLSLRDLMELSHNTGNLTPH